jgi:hypothetical protein
MNKKQPFAIHTIRPDEPGMEPLKVVLPKDGTRGLVIGEDWEVRALYDLIEKYLENGKHSGQIEDYHEQLGTAWITTVDAASLAEHSGHPGIPERTIRWAASHGYIRGAQKHGRDWRFPRATFLYWLKNRPKPGRKAEALAHIDI